MKRSSYISKSACRGFRPHAFASYDGRQRGHLISRLIKERATARFIVAPFGYGKTRLAVDYAETVFAWVHVFWMNAQSPCFIRDLDAGIISDDCFEHDKAAKLVVIDDLPQLDATRTELLSNEIDQLLKRGCEVLVCCTPSCDLLGSLQPDRLRLSASELLLNDEEVDEMRSEDDRLRNPASQVAPSARVPALVWGEKTDASAFVAHCLDEDLPADLLLAACSAFVLQRGALSELATLGPIDRALIEDVFVDYPHFGFDVDSDWYRAPSVDVDVLEKPLKKRLDTMVARSSFASRAELTRAWANMLLSEKDSAGRACDVMRLFCPMSARAGWMLGHAQDLVASGCFYPWLCLLAGLSDSRRDDRPHLSAAEGLCRMLLGDRDGAIMAVKRYAFDDGAPQDAKVVSQLLVAFGGAGELSSRASSLLIQRAANVSLEPGGDRVWWDDLALVWSARAKGTPELATMWTRLRDAGATRIVLCLGASWLYTQIRGAKTSGDPCDIRDLLQVERYVRKSLSPYGDEPVDFFAASAGMSLEEAHEDGGLAYLEGHLSSPTVMELSRVRTSMMVQHRRFERDAKLNRAAQAGWSATPAPLGTGIAEIAAIEGLRAVPTLEMRFFGRFDVSIGGISINHRLASCKHARSLLVLLTVNRGRDLSRDAVVEAMWPASEPATARKNFYTVWSQLRRALTLEDGTCPYLVRHKFGCHLEERFTKSDVARLDDICRELQFGRVDFEVWPRLYAELERDYSGDLLPSEINNVLVVRERKRYRSRLADSLVTATQRLIEAGSPPWAIWFARAALHYDKVREDAYVALMRAQIADEQRTAAMMTYLECRRVLAEELGIDPSPETDALYRSLLGDE